MNKTIKQMVNDIKKSSERENLVVFIGAGVSVNSGYRLWDSLIGLFNEKLKYSSKTSHFSTDEMLKIPQYYYNENSEKYYEVIRNEYAKLPDQTNAIIDEVLKLNPMHIITTNFDLLIEKSLVENHIYGNTVHGSLGKYSIIRSDDDFVSATKNHYLIKMHGDVESLESLVLKEEDYLQYSSTHALIETFIKSLFVNHTILFIGYGLGDYNIKLVMSWVDGVLQKRQEEKDNYRFSYYFINSGLESLKDYEKDYYRKQNIFVIENSDVPADFSEYNHNKDTMIFEDIRGNNLFKICKYIKYGRDNDVGEIMKNLSVFNNIDCITVKEVMSKLDNYIGLHNMYDNTLNCIEEQLSMQLKTIINLLENSDETTEILYFTSVFKKAGIDTIAVESSKSDYKQIIKLSNIHEKTDVLYASIIECNIKNLYGLSQNPCKNQRAMLQTGYVCSVLGEDIKATQLFEKAMSHYNSDNDFFRLLICQQNICKIEIKERQIWYLLKNNLSEEDKDTFRTLYNYLDDSDEIYQQTVETYKRLERKFDVNYHSISSDEDNLIFLELRYNIHQIQKYFIMNNIYIKGYSGYTQVIGNWLKSLDLYVDLLLMLHSSNTKMHRENKTYKRNSIKKEDIYLLVNHLKNEDLKYLLKKYNINQIEVCEECTDYIISILNNYIDAFEFKNILGFKFANDIKNILRLIQKISFTPKQYNSVFQSMKKLLKQIMTTHFDNEDYYFTVFRGIPIEILEFIFFMLRFHKSKVKKESIENIIESVLLIPIKTSTEDSIAMRVFRECGILQNLSTAFEYYYKCTISEDITNQFLETMRDKYPQMLNNLIIESFPILSDKQKTKWREAVDVLEIESYNLRFGIINSVFYYNDKICDILVNLCRQQVKEKSPEKEKNLHLKPLYSVLRLFEKDYITDLKPYVEFTGYYDFFDFVCFPNNFDYKKYDTSWGSWLTLEKYRKPAFKTSYETLKEKYEQTMKDGPSDIEKSIYYKFFYFENN